MHKKVKESWTQDGGYWPHCLYIVTGPGVTTWYRFLETKLGHGLVCGKHNPRLSRIVGVKKMVLDQLIFAPLFLGAFLLLIGRLKCKKWERNVDDVRRQYPDVLTSNYMIWPFVQLINFTFVPVHMQVLLVQSVALFWNTYLSWRTAKPAGDGQGQLEIPENERIIDSYWCKPKTTPPITPKEEIEAVPLPPKCKKKEEPSIIEEPEPPSITETSPTDDGKFDECIPDEDDRNKAPEPPEPPPSFVKPNNTNNMYFLIQTAMLLSIILLTLN